jgi:hypothetical protein
MAIIPADEKVFMVDKRTNTTYGGSQALQDMQQWYTMQDVSDSVGGALLPYKVYTALLTQSGASENLQIDSGDLTIGVTYMINDDSGNPDFTNVGAPNNSGNTYFVATGTTPNSWGNSGASLIYNTGAPVVTVLENTIGNIWFEYKTDGIYAILCNNLFIEDKSWYTPVIISNTANLTNGLMVWRGDDEIRIVTNLDGALANTLLSSTPIEIRVYN